MKRFALTPVVLAFAACAPSPARTEAPVAPPQVEAPPLAMPALAVIENQPGSAAGLPSRFVVRMVFQNSTGNWRSTNPDCEDEACLASSAGTWPPTAAWTVVNAGAIVGRVTGTTPNAWTRYADVGVQEIARTADIPKVGAPTKGWSDADIDLQRPLAAISIPKASDPEAWKEAPLSAEALAALRSAFITQFDDVQNCEANGGDLKPMKYKAADIVLSAARVSNRDWRIATAQLTGYRCDGPLEGAAFAPQAFAISPDGKVRYLGEGLKLVDAGDFDGNGQSELLYAIQRGNAGGYELYSNDFADRATFAFNYH